MSITEAMIEAGVVALYDDFAERMGYPVRYAMLDERAKAAARQSWGPRVSMAFTAALAAAEARGAVLAVLPDEKDWRIATGPMMSDECAEGWWRGVRDHRAAFLRGRVVV